MADGVARVNGGWPRMSSPSQMNRSGFVKRVIANCAWAGKRNAAG